MTEDRRSGLDSGGCLNPACHAGGMTDTLSVDDDVVLFAAFPVVDDIVDEEIRKGAMQKGTKAIVSESPSSVPKLHIKTISKPVNSTLYIVSEMYISPPDILAGEVTN